MLTGVTSLKSRPYLGLLLLTCGALLVHGYHPAVEDGEIYIPGIKKILNPALYPFGAEFFQNHASLTLFGRLIAASVRVSHLPLDTALFLWYVASIFLTLLACWEWSNDCFSEPEARWAGVALTASFLTLPVAGTSLYIADQYLTPRSIVLFAVLFAIRNLWRDEYGRFILWSVVAAVIHPLMAAFGISFGLVLVVMKRLEARRASIAKPPEVPAALMSALPLVPVASAAYRAAVHTRSYFFILQWEWYEWIGIFAPLFILWWFSRIAERNDMAIMRLISRSLIVFTMIYFVAALVLTIPAYFETLARLQPMRSLHLVYTALILLGGGMIGKYVLKQHAWRWLLLFVPVCAGMGIAQLEIFPDSPHVEWPGAAPGNDWLRAFEWIRLHTPANAIFALDPEYMRKDDQHGFRAMAERSRLADAVKDSGAVTMFPEPPTAEHWLEQTTDLNNWNHFRLSDFQRLKNKYGVSWVVLQRPGIDGLPCPYENASLRVCQIDQAE
jgi:hypothetical protein